MSEEAHDPLQCLTQLRQTLSADKLSIGFFLGAGCPCAVRIPQEGGIGDRAIIPDVKGLTTEVLATISKSDACGASYEALTKTFDEDGLADPTIEAVLNRIRSFREVAGRARVRGISFEELNTLDQEICQIIRSVVTCSLPNHKTPYHALAAFVERHRAPFTEIFTTNYDVLIEQALEDRRVPYFDGFVGSSRPFFDQRAIEDEEIPSRWSRLWKLHGSINWRFNKSTKVVFRSDNGEEGDELLIHPSHRKYDDSRRMPYFVMIDRLRSFLRNAERPVALFISGYSFRDEHINEAIIESLTVNASAACFALQFGSLSEYPEATKLANKNSSLSVLAPDAAIIRRRYGRWLASPTVDFATLTSAFEPLQDRVENVGEGTKEANGAEWPRPCRMRLGDFGQLGNFLDEFSGYSRIPSGVDEG